LYNNHEILSIKRYMSIYKATKTIGDFIVFIGKK